MKKTHELKCRYSDDFPAGEKVYIVSQHRSDVAIVTNSWRDMEVLTKDLRPIEETHTQGE